MSEEDPADDYRSFVHRMTLFDKRSVKEKKLTTMHVIPISAYEYLHIQ